MEKSLNFNPLIKNPYCQTVLGTALDFESNPASTTHFVKLIDGDLMAVEISTPLEWIEEKGIVVLLHGLCGSHKSQYMKRLTKRFYAKGHKVARINMRGCGSGRGLARGIYHNGCSGDIRAVLEDLRGHFPTAPMVLAGFSMGGNITLKLAGELGEDGPKYLKGCIAVGPPVELVESTRLITHPKNDVYAKYFLKILLNEVFFLHNHFKDLPPHGLNLSSSLNDFDEIYVAPRAKFSSALEYYYHCSAKRVILNTKIPTYILFAKDDPIIKSTSLDDLELPPHINVYKTEHGGHIGFLGWNIFKEFRWMDNLVEEWVGKLI
jgi:uncharacterized protein